MMRLQGLKNLLASQACAKYRGKMIKKTALPPEFPKSLKELIDYIKPIPKDTTSAIYLTHAFGTTEMLKSAIMAGIRPSYGSGKAFFSPNGLVRDKGHGYVVIKITPKEKEKYFEEGIDVVEATLKYPELRTKIIIPPDKFYKVVPNFGGVNADLVAKYALNNQGLDNSDVRELPDKYRSWFYITKKITK